MQRRICDVETDNIDSRAVVGEAVFEREMKFTIDSVCPKPRMTQSDKWKQRPSVLRYRAYADELRLNCRGIGMPDTLRLTFFIEMPKSWSKKKRDAMWREPHQSKPDIDNLTKSVLDALFTNDGHVWKVEAQKRWEEKSQTVIEVI